MSEDYVQLLPDGAGKKLRTINRANKHDEVVVPVSLDGLAELGTFETLLRFLMQSPLLYAVKDSNRYLFVDVGSALPSSSNRIGVVVPTQRLLATPYTDSTTALAANTVFTGTARDCQISTSSPYDHLGVVQAFSYADVAGTLFVQESPDNTTWVTVERIDAVSIVDTDGSTARFIATVNHKVTLRYVRLVYRNGAAIQTVFRLSSRVIGA